MTDWGRFFPGSATWTVAIFSTLQTRLSYKVFLAALALLMIVLTMALVGTLTHRAAAPVVVVALRASLTLRNWFDGLDTFSGVLALTICLTLGSALLLVRGRGWPSAVIASLLWAYALLTYEVAILLTPTLIFTVWSARGRWQRTLPMIVPTLCVMATVGVLRARATYPPGNAYTINLDFSGVLTTYLRQTLSALPLAEQWYPGAAPLIVDRSLVILMIALIGVPAAVVLTAVSRIPSAENWPKTTLAALLGFSCWLLPPLLVGVSLGWQNDLPPGEGYVSVVWGYVGVAILMAVGWMLIARRAAARPTRVRKFSLHAATLMLSLLCALTVAQSATIATIAQTYSM